MAEGVAYCSVCHRVVWARDVRLREGDDSPYCLLCVGDDALPAKPVREYDEVDELLESLEE